MTTFPSRRQQVVDGILLIGLAIGEVVGGPLPWRIGPFTVLTVVAGVGVIVRSIWNPRAHIGTTIRYWWQGTDSDWWAPAVAALSRIAVIAVGLGAVGLIGYELQPGQYRPSRNEILNLPMRFDAGWYLGIARHGYEQNPAQSGGQHAIAFFPLHPVLMRLGGEMLTLPAKAMASGFMGNGDTRVTWGGVLVAIVSIILASPWIVRLGEREESGASATGRWTLLFCLAYPFAFFFSAPYSEGLFLLCLTGTLLAWHEGRLTAAGLWGVAAGLTRSNGWTLSAALLIDVLARAQQRRTGVRRLLPAFGPLLGVTLYSAYVWWLTGSPLSWMRVQQGWGRSVEPLAFVTRRLRLVESNGLIGYLVGAPDDALSFLCVCLMISIAGYLLWQRRWLYGALILAYLAPGVAIDLPSLGRMTAVALPAFIVIAAGTPPRLRVPLLVLSALIQAWMAARFFLWQPPF